MANKYVLAEDIEREIARLEKSPMVALARKCEQVEYERRQLMAELQRLEEKGIALATAGFSVAQLEALTESIYAE